MRGRILIYALGGGWGHLARSLALGRAAALRGLHVHLLCNSPHAGQAGLRDELGNLGTFEALGLDQAKPAVLARVHELLDRDWDALVVDTFPRGLLGELAAVLPSLSYPKFWVHRDLSTVYAERFSLREFARHFDTVFAPGEHGPLADLPHCVRTAPWLVRDAEELLDRESARAGLGLTPSDGPGVVVLGCGTPEEVAETRKRATRLQGELGPGIRVLAVGPGLELSHWPLLECMPGVDLLIGAGGYHTVHETRATGTPLLAFPRARLYDRQARRLTQSEQVAEGDLAARAREVLGQLETGVRKRLPPNYVNGVHLAVDVLEGALSGRLDGLRPGAVGSDR